MPIRSKHLFKLVGFTYALCAPIVAFADQPITWNADQYEIYNEIENGEECLIVRSMKQDGRIKIENPCNYSLHWSGPVLCGIATSQLGPTSSCEAYLPQVNRQLDKKQTWYYDIPWHADKNSGTVIIQHIYTPQPTNDAPSCTHNSPTPSPPSKPPVLFMLSIIGLIAVFGRQHKQSRSN